MRGKTKLCGHHNEEAQEVTLHPVWPRAGRGSYNKQIFNEGLICARNHSWIKLENCRPCGV